MERITINTHNLPENEVNISDFKAAFGDALKAAPSDSHLCCCIHQEDNSYVLNMRIHSTSGHFPIHAQTKSIENLIQLAVGKMKMQFKKWHKDPKKYADDHKMGERPCLRKDESVLICPLGSYANKKFEEEYRM